MNSSHNAPPADAMIARVRGELSTARRTVYRVLLVITAIWTGALLAMWLTEPEPLPTRTNVAFAIAILIGVAWIGLYAWILTRKNCPTAGDRIATGWMATLACLVFVLVSVPIAVSRGDGQAAMTLAAAGTCMLVAAALMLRNAYSVRAVLRERLRELE